MGNEFTTRKIKPYTPHKHYFFAALLRDISCHRVPNSDQNSQNRQLSNMDRTWIGKNTFASAETQLRSRLKINISISYLIITVFWLHDLLFYIWCNDIYDKICSVFLICITIEFWMPETLLLCKTGYHIIINQLKWSAPPQKSFLRLRLVLYRLSSSYRKKCWSGQESTGSHQMTLVVTINWPPNNPNLRTFPVVYVLVF